MSEFKPCPFCGQQPAWRSRPVFGTGMEPPLRALGCLNTECCVQPQTKWRDTAKCTAARGWISVNHDETAIAEWNARHD